MMMHEGGCLCGALRYATQSIPNRVWYCHCKFCQRATGGAYLVEPVFSKVNFSVTSGEPARYSSVSAGSGKAVITNFCANCGTKLFLEFERFPDGVGLFGGTYDVPNWFETIRDLPRRHIFLASAQIGTVIPSGIEVYREHAMLNDGTPVAPMIFDAPHVIGTPRV